MFTVVVAWLAVLAVGVAAVLFGQTARGRPRRRRRRSPAARVGLFVSRSGPWVVTALATAVGARTGAWLPAAAVGAAGIVVAAVVGLGMDPG